MSTTKVIEDYRNLVVQIATPFSTGTGFIMPSRNIILTNEHVVRGNQEVLIRGNNQDIFISKVLFIDEVYDLAFLALSEEITSSVEQLSKSKSYIEGAQIIAIGHPFGLKYTATEGVISSTSYVRGEVAYIQHDAALNPGNSGGPLIDQNGALLGINTFIMRQGNSIGFSLPVEYIDEDYKLFDSVRREQSIRCDSCRVVLLEEEHTTRYCNNCGHKVQFIKDFEPYEPLGVCKQIEDLLEGLGYNPAYSRRGLNHWSILRGSATIEISYHEKSGLIIADAHVCNLPQQGLKELYTYMLSENYRFNDFAFSVQDSKIIITWLAYDQYIKWNTAKAQFDQLFSAADHYDNILVEKYGASYRRKS